jgi:predicted flap endonuclease-1-like 5' DNA nuclease
MMGSGSAVRAERIAGLLVCAAAVAALPRRGPEPPIALVPCRDGVLIGQRLYCGPDVAAAGCTGESALRPGDVLPADGDCDRALRERMSPEDLETLAVPVDLDAASEADLTSLPGIGPVLARRIVEARPFQDVDDLLRVSGIGPRRLEAVRERVFVGTVRAPSPPAPPRWQGPSGNPG